MTTYPTSISIPQVEPAVGDAPVPPDVSERIATSGADLARTLERIARKLRAKKEH